MNGYDNHLKVKDALEIYFSKYHFPGGGYDLKWFKIKVGFIYIPLPNTKGRVAAVKIHDVHHLITQYEATLRGEAEIAGWEIASSCGKYSAAWVLNFGSFFYGIFFFPIPLFRAFMRGRTVKTNYYYHPYDDILLNKTLGEVREETEESIFAPYSFTNYLLFILCCIFTLTAAITFVFLLYKIGMLFL
jgi:hypothetical protein